MYSTKTDLATLFFQALNQVPPSLLDTMDRVIPPPVVPPMIPGPADLAAPEVIVPIAVGMPNHAKIPLPRPFDGSRDPLTIESWLFDLNEYCSYYGMTEAQKLRLVTAYLKGEAGIWWKNTYRQIQLGRLPRFEQWAQFEAAFRRKFIPHDYQFELRSKLLRIYQNNKSVQEFIAEFQKITILMVELSVREEIHTFITHLRPELGREVNRHHPVDMETAIELAQAAEELENRYDRKKRPQQQQDKGKKKEQDWQKDWNSYFGTDPMDLDNIGVKGKGKQKLSKSERQ